MTEGNSKISMWEEPHTLVSHLHKNTTKQAAYIIIWWAIHEQWLGVHTSNLMMTIIWIEFDLNNKK